MIRRPPVRRLLRRLAGRPSITAPPASQPMFPAGHYHSPVVNTEELIADRDRVWPQPSSAPGIDWNDAGQRRVLTEFFPRHISLYDYPEVLPDGPDLAGFYTRNPQFSWLDARALFVLLHEWRPKHVIEVGSGYSSLLIADVNARWFDNQMQFTTIDPFPAPFLARPITGITTRIETRVQDVPPSDFTSLGPGDILFIDSSHVTKTGSDVNHLFFHVLPELAPGVHIHVHDIFLPSDYPQEWAIDMNLGWNEQYVVQALLMHSHGYAVEFGSLYAWSKFTDLVEQALALPNGGSFAGGSLWLTKLV